ncbi:DUF3889 domain-containing protein [Paenibacillus sedimenti]|uniref:DUF3889 domain-containing protein n=1 Tax=Paenibacillus sedimenti TaxID=2770274 RepID=A0A926QJI2_9BACL|nr:DUF3889 domain-containing protein [Paenibacillus sedimenti]MBD0381746.1 DUF3889 domain-containing protein [Paenibacillus sedimenti]
MNKATAVLLVFCTCWYGCRSAPAKAMSEATFVVQQQVKELVRALEPEYAKWSRMAFHEAGKIYTLLDYKYLGRTDVAPGVAQQQFRFWVKKNGSEFPLIVSIRYNPVTEKVYTIIMEQEKRGDLRVL